ncbi:MAG: methyltransferase domain-containing protein [Phycisphaerae bacterium]|nr:methyltransferase domain-containing protein [Phycisphaerae bacterium]
MKHSDGEHFANCYFILSCARSGSTSLCRILDQAENGRCVMEPTPNLNVETRDAMDGRLHDLEAVVDTCILPRIAQQRDKSIIYGEKNVTYGPFIAAMYEKLHCRFVFLKRDGRDVVRSLLDWHNRKFGTIYRECKDTSGVTDSAFASAANLLAHNDTSDYSRPRPLPGKEYYDEWESMTRLEMCAYYWRRVNQLYVDGLASIPAEAWIALDYTNPSAGDILRVVDFLGLEGLDEQKIGQMLDSRINSLKDRGVSDGVPTPPWPDWPAEWRRKFDRVAGGMMARLGYYESSRDALQNAAGEEGRFGAFWRAHDGGEPWYRWMYEHRKAQHKAFEEWFRCVAQRESLESVADFGCGAAIGYTDFFASIRYVGMDLAESIIHWCRNTYSNPRHEFRAVDFIRRPPQKEFDLVMSQGTIDNVYDMDAFLNAAVQAAKKWIYITAYRGYFGDLSEHVYRHNEEQGVYYNDISPAAAYNTLKQAGCRDISIHPSPTGREDIPFETVIIAHV